MVFILRLPIGQPTNQILARSQATHHNGIIDYRIYYTVLSYS